MSGEKRIGVYICHCGLNIAQTVDVESVGKFASELEGVVVARNYSYMCSDPGQDLIKKDIRELKLNGVVVAACSPSMHEITFQKAAEEAGLNPYLVQMTSIREMVSWVTDEREKATEKAKVMVRAAVNRVRYQTPLERKRSTITPAALVVGGGVAGIEAALKIAEAGKKVYLVEREPTIGGHMAQLDKTFPTLDCSACILTPKMVDVARNPNIELLAYSEVVKVSGFVGNYEVKILRKPRYVNADKCTGDGACASKCPLRVPNEFDLGLGKRKAIYVPFPQAVPLKYTIDKEHCLYFTKGTCRICEKVCAPKAIDFEQKSEDMTIKVGSIVLATGYDSFDPSAMKQYGYGVLENVYTGLEFERLANASGPTNGSIVLKNGQSPKSIAIMHCVGSRDENYHPYCSRVCCMYAMKFGHLVRERIPDAKVYEFYIDIRAFGKGYEEFYKRVLEEGVLFVRGKGAQVSHIYESKEEVGKLIVDCEDTLLGVVRRIPVDMVILATALEPRRDSKDIARLFSLPCGSEGWFMEKHPKLAPVATATAGIFLAGACQSPKDIPDSVAQGAAAAAEVISLIDKGFVPIEPTISEVDQETCTGCKVCLELCPYKAIEFDEGKNVAHINEPLCLGCGVCVAACPTSSIQQKGFTDAQILAEVEEVVA